LNIKFFLKNKQDFIAAASIFVLSFIFYYLGCKDLLASGFYEKINIAFDLDQSWYFDTIGRDSTNWLFKTATDIKPLLIKHPFIYLYHYVVLVMNTIGISNDMSVILLSQFFHSGSLVISYFIFRSIGLYTLQASFLTFGLAGTSTYIATGLVLDIYSLSIFWISAIFLIVCKAVYQKYDSPVWLRVGISIMAIGTTSYLILLVLMMEFSLAKIGEGKLLGRLSVINLYKQFSRIFLLGIFIFVLIYFDVLIEVIKNPVNLLKRVFWAVNRPGEKEGILQVISVFTMFSVLSPKISNIGLPEGITMIDLRVMDFSNIGWSVIFIISIFIFLNFKKNNYSGIVFFSLLWIIINIFFHTVYQYRGSLFLYSGHFILAVWIIYFVPFKNYDNEIVSKIPNRIAIYIVPLLIWLNNLYLYNKIISI